MKSLYLLKRQIQEVFVLNNDSWHRNGKSIDSQTRETIKRDYAACVCLWPTTAGTWSKACPQRQTVEYIRRVSVLFFLPYSKGLPCTFFQSCGKTAKGQKTTRSTGEWILEGAARPDELYNAHCSRDRGWGTSNPVPLLCYRVNSGSVWATPWDSVSKTLFFLEKKK